MFKNLNWIMNGTPLTPFLDGDMGGNNGGGTSSTGTVSNTAVNATVQSGTSESASPVFNSLADTRNSVLGMFQPPTEGQGIQGTVPQVNPVQQPLPQTQPEPELILGKFKTKEDLAKSYTELEQYNSRRNAELSQKSNELVQRDNELAQLRQQLENQRTQNQASNVPQPQQAPQMQQEPLNGDIEAKREALNNLFYDDILEFDKKFKEEAKAEALAAFKQEFGPELKILENQKISAEMNRKVQEFQQIHPDLLNMSNEIFQVIQMFPELNQRPDGLEKAYAAATQLKQINKPPEQLLQDQNFVDNYIINNPNIENRIVQSYMQKVRQQQSNIPTQINSGNGGMIPLTPENKPKTMDDAASIAKRMLGGF